MEGGAGNDIARGQRRRRRRSTSSSTAQGQRVTATRDNGAPFFLDIGTTETLDLNTERAATTSSRSTAASAR